MHTEKHKKLKWLALLLSLFGTAASAQETKLEPGQSVTRTIAGGEVHSYQIPLQAGQFARFRLEQQALDCSLLLLAPDGKPLIEMNLIGAGAPESLSLAASSSSPYRLEVRGNGRSEEKGSYRLEAMVSATITPSDRQRLAAESLSLEAFQLSRQTGKDQTVIEKLQQALTIWQELGESFWAVWALQRSAIAHNNLRQPQLALEALEKAGALTREVKNRRLEALVLARLGSTWQQMNQPPKAIEAYEQARAIYRELQDPYSEGQTLFTLGELAYNVSRFEKSLEYNEQARALFRSLHARLEEGRALLSLGSSQIQLGRTDIALEHIQQALSIFRELKNRLYERNALTTLGRFYGNRGQMETAVGYFEQTLALSRELQDRQGEGIALGNLGLGYYFLGQYETTVQYSEQALQLARDTKNRSSEGYALSHLGSAYDQLGQVEKAIACKEQSLAIFRELKDRYMEGNSLQQLWNSYTSLGRHEQAIAYVEQAIAIFREVKYRVGEANAVSGLGLSYNQLGRYEEAMACNEQALTIHREVKYRPGEAAALLEIGRAHMWLKRPEKALEIFEQSLAIYREVKNRFGEGVLILKTGEAKLQLGRAAEAEAALTEAVNIMREVGRRSAEVEALTALARLERTKGNIVAARTLMESSLRVTESLRTDLVSPESRTAFLSTVQDSYQLLTDLLMQQHQREPQRGLNALALEVVERQHARSLLDLLTESRADVRQGVDAALVARERALAKQLNDKAQQLAQATKAEQITALKQQISQLEIELERAQADIRKASPHYAALTQPQPLKLNEIQQLLDADTLLLEYALGEEHSYLWAVTKDTLTSYELPKGEEIEKSARQVYDLLIARSTVKRGETIAQRRQRIAEANTRLPALAAGLSQMILAPVAAQLGNKRLVIVADGALQYVPFAMLPEPVVGGRWSVVGQSQPLIVKHEIVSLPSASALAIQRREIAGRMPAPKMLAVIADPVFDRSDARLTNVAATDNENAKAQTRSFDDQRSIVHLAEKPDDTTNVATRKLVIPRLPFTRQEATQLLALAPPDATLGALGFQASRTAVLSSALGQYRYVHFATHGVLDSERPGLSSLLLSMVDESGKPQDGFLRANDIYNLKLPAELVVLSACQTGLGKEIKGEGLVGLTRGFMYAGAARVVVSLWNVNDQATAELMTKFYRRMLKQGERPAAALRAAQVEMWKQKQWSAPFYWAAFTLQGEWK